MHPTTIKILKVLKRHNLNADDKQEINTLVEESTAAAYNEESNGCDCMQPSCSFCN